MVKGNDLVKSNYWTYPYLAYIVWIQMCVCLKMSVIYIYKCHILFQFNNIVAFYENVCI